MEHHIWGTEIAKELLLIVAGMVWFGLLLVFNSLLGVRRKGSCKSLIFDTHDHSKCWNSFFTNVPTQKYT